MRKIAAVLAILCAMTFLVIGQPAAAQDSGTTTYVVQPGDNLFRIGLKFGVSAQDIARVNGIVNPNVIYVGQSLIIPTPGEQPPTLTATPTARFGWIIGMQQMWVVTKEQVGAIPAGTAVRIGSAHYDGKGWLYDITAGDNVFEEARDEQLDFAAGVTPGAPTPTLTEVPVTATATITPEAPTEPPTATSSEPTATLSLATIEPSPTEVPPTATLEPSATLPPTETLVPTETLRPSVTSVPTEPPPVPEFYTVQPGDYLARIALRFNTTVDVLIQLNQGTITNPNVIFVGQVLRIKPAVSSPTSQTTEAPATETAVPADTSTPEAVIEATAAPAEATAIEVTPTPTEAPAEVQAVPTETPTETVTATSSEPTATLFLPTLDVTATETVAPTAEPATVEPATAVPFGGATEVPTTEAPLPPAPTATEAPVMNNASNEGFGFGLEVDYRGVDAAGLTARVKDLGTAWVKQHVYWKDLEPVKGQIDFTALDAQIAEMNSAGAKIMLTVSRAPEWARGTNVEDGPAADNQDFVNFVTALAQRYKGQVKAWEIWERPNVRREWNGKPISAATYVEMLRLVYGAIKGADPDALVVSAGLASTGFNDGLNAINDRIFLMQGYQAGLAAYSDAIGVQPAGFANPPDSTCCEASPGVSGWFNDRSFYFKDTLTDYRKIMVDNQDGSTFLWVTSFGWGAADGIVADPTAIDKLNGFVEFTDQNEQAQYTVRALEIGKSLGYIGPMFLSNLNACQSSNPNAPASEFASCYYSLLDPAGNARPVYDAVKGAAK